MDRDYAKVEHHRNFADFLINLDFATLKKKAGIAKIGSCSVSKVSRLCPSVNFRRLSSGSIPSYCTSGSTQPEWEEGGQPNCGPLCTFAEQTNQAFYKREGNFSPKEAVGMKEAGRMVAYPLLFLERIAILKE